MIYRKGPKDFVFKKKYIYIYRTHLMFSIGLGRIDIVHPSEEY